MGLAGADLSQDQRLFGGRNHRWWALVTVDIGILMSTLDASIVNIALPTILTSLEASLAATTWVVMAYLLAITVLLLPFGRLSDIMGRKRLYTVGLALFAVGSGLCGVSADVGSLIAFRIVQAAGAAMVTAIGFAIVTAAFPAWQRGLALGINGTVVAVGITLGPTVGGVLIETLGWRWIFLVNLPIGAIGAVASWAILNERLISGGREMRGQSFDLAGAAVAAVALVSMLLALTQGPEAGWSSALVLSLLGLSLLAAGLFVVVEMRVPEPLVDLALFRHRAFAAGNVAGLLAFLAIAANAFLMPFYLQVVQGFDALRAGLLMTPTPLAMALVAPLSGWLSDRVGAKILSSLGLAGIVVALLLLAGLTPESDYSDVVVRLLLLGLGLGVFQSPNNSSVMGDVPRERLGIGSGILSLMRNLGTVVGVAAGAAFLLGSLAAAGITVGVGTLESGVAPEEARRELVSAFMAGLRQAYLAAAAFAALGVAASLARGPGAAPAPTRRG